MILSLLHAYRAKKPAASASGYTNDRVILWIGVYELQYDSPSIPNGDAYKRVTHDEFLKWAGRDVTSELPKGEWMPYAPGLK